MQKQSRHCNYAAAQQQGQWVHSLTAAQIGELEAAIAALMQLRDPAQFQLLLLAPVLAAMQAELSAGRGFYLIKGLPVQQWSRDGCVMCAYLGLGLHLGVAIPQNQKGHLIGRVKPAKSGGQSSWASSSTIYNEMLAASPELGYMTVSFHDTYYQAAAARFPDQVPPLTTTQQAALALFNETAGRADVRLDCWLEPGDMQFLNNHNTVHTRSQFIYWELVVPQLRPLPPAAFDTLWGPMAADDRCAQQLSALGDAAVAESHAATVACEGVIQQAAAAAMAAAPAADGIGVSAALAARDVIGAAVLPERK
ncbi:hypothetical protein COO60DRAFT_1700521 [Scenedesmus sp. NREL 46B-D3]|nr:hypothetical protein COO60DRAFT_1700521 [Scenedesmus sp. NREL 46B-D3]